LKEKETSGFKPNVNFPLPSKGWREAFTLIELLVVIAIIAILASVLLPVLHQAQLRGETAACIANQSQLAKGWVMYSSDNNDYCPGNYWQDEQHWRTHAHENWVSGWVGVAGTGGDGINGNQGGPDNTNAQLLVNPTYSTMGDYMKNPKVFLCPSSQVRGTVSLSSSAPDYLICRSVSMNCWFGYNTSVLGDPSQGIGPYFSTAYKVFKKMSDIKAGIGPSDAFVFMEERAESIDDGWFAAPPPGTLQLVNWPTDYHNGAATVGFADGHVEVHRWQNAKFSNLNAPGGANFLTPQDPTPGAKWGGATVSSLFPGGQFWIEQHATCLNQ
jgi:prepilin-type N-terminal cleavage/methylation domain-containing protein/prepilin-type processing-associated H-X9-DG protein